MKTPKLANITGILTSTASIISIIIMLIAAFKVMEYKELQRDNIATIERLTNELTLCEEYKSFIRDDSSDLKHYILARYTRVPDELAEIIAVEAVAASKEFGIDFYIVSGVMEVESGFNPFAESHKGAVGLMQIMPTIWVKELGLESKENLYSIRQNIRSGTEIIKHYLKKSNGVVRKALTNYNGGGKDYADKVFTAIGRFTAFRSNTYNLLLEGEKKDDVGKEPTSGNTEVSTEVSENRGGQQQPN